MLPILMLLGLFLAHPALAAPAQEEQPVAIQADSMEYLQKAGRIVFRGTVHATREDMELWADTVTVHLEEGTAQATATAPQGKVRSIVAEGNVRIQTTQNRSGTGKRATFDARTETVTLEGDPEVREGKNSIRGEVIILYLKDGKSEVRGGAKQRVEAIFLAPKAIPGLEKKP
ncbi:MAG: lipopolysaccharide transport periplasmic protein LptA [Desulfomicrobiaceae bacterium]